MIVLRFFYSIYFHLVKAIIAFLSSSIYGVLIILLFFIGKKRIETIGYYVGKTWANLTLFMSGIRIKSEVLDNLDADKHYVFAGNHQSSFDIYLYYKYIPQKFVWVSKKQIALIPIFGWVFKMSGAVLVERENSNKAAVALKNAVKKIKAGISIAIFPEGTRSKDGNLLPFKKGAFVLARLSKLDIVPIIIKDSSKVAPKGKFLLDPRQRIEIKILEPEESKDKKIEERFKGILLGELA